MGVFFFDRLGDYNTLLFEGKKFKLGGGIFIHPDISGKKNISGL